MNKLGKAAAGGVAYAGMWMFFLRDVEGGFFVALVLGVLFTPFMLWMLGRQAKKATGMRRQLEGEGIVKDTAASLSGAWNHTQGWLFLTKQRLVFLPFAASNAKLRFDAPLARIERGLTRGLLGRTRLVVTAEGDTRKIALDAPELWLVVLEQTTAALTSGGGNRTGRSVVKKFLGMVAAAGFPFGGGMTLYFMSTNGSSKGIVLGVACGLLFGLIIATIRMRRIKFADEIRPQFEAEGLLRDSAAARLVDKRISHGWLFLTKQRLVFTTNKGSASERLELPLDEIASVKLLDGAIKKQVHVIDKVHQTHAFITMDRELWVIWISRALAPELSPEGDARESASGLS